MAKETVLGDVQGMSGQCTVETLFILVSEMLPKLTLWAVGTERECCLYHAHRDLAGGRLLGGDTGKSPPGLCLLFLLFALWFGFAQ